MTATECIKILRDNPNISISKACRLTNLSKEDVRRYAAYAGIELISVRKAKAEICSKKPYCCDKCPFSDCIDNSPATVEETEFVEKALQRRKKNER